MFNQPSNKLFIFSPFVDLLNTHYIPSKFVERNLDDFYPLKFILNNQDIKFEYNRNAFIDIISTLYTRLEASEALVKDLLDIATKR
jgi:hypothetical protein